MFCFHYWRRREPPVSLSCGNFRSGFIANAMFLVFILVVPNNFHGKTNGLVHLAHSHKEIDLSSAQLTTTTTTTHTEFFPLLATTGSARSPQLRVFSFEFFAKQYCFTQCEKFATVKIRVWALFQFTEGNYMFFSHYRRRREPPVSLRCGCFRSSFLQNSTVLHKAKNLQR